MKVVQSAKGESHPGSFLFPVICIILSSCMLWLGLLQCILRLLIQMDRRKLELTSPQTGMAVFAKAVLEGLSSGRSGNPLET